MSSEKCWIGDKAPKVQRSNCSPRWYCKRQFWPNAVFTEQGSSASQMTAAKIMDITHRLPSCDGQAADAVSAYTQVKMEDAHKLLKIPKSECPDIWIRLPRHEWPKSWSSMEDPIVPLVRNLHGHPVARLLWEKQFGKILLKHGWEKIPNWEYFYSSWERIILIYVCGWHKNWLERNKILIRCGNYSTKKSIWENQHLSWITFSWDALNDNAKQAKILLTITEPCSNREFLRVDWRNYHSFKISVFASWYVLESFPFLSNQLDVLKKKFLFCTVSD